MSEQEQIDFAQRLSEITSDLEVEELRAAQTQSQTGRSPAGNRTGSCRGALEGEYERLQNSTLAASTMSDQEQIDHAQRPSEIISMLEQEQLHSVQIQSPSNQGQHEAQSIEVVQPDTGESAGQGCRGHLPLGLCYPTASMIRREERIQERLAEAREARRELELQRVRQQEQAQQVQLEQRREQEQQRRQEEERRRARERERREQEARENQQFQELMNEGRIGGIQLTGGARMCGQCGAGPFTNEACRDMQAHNNDGGRNRNHCPHCGWFSPNWSEWPQWDGGVRRNRRDSSALTT
jgi:hypothetical protein